MSATYAQRKALGDYGERLAAAELERRGLEVLDRNWRCREGEIDIVARHRGSLVVCEVKTRRGDRYGSALEAITPVSCIVSAGRGASRTPGSRRRCASMSSPCSRSDGARRS